MSSISALYKKIESKQRISPQEAVRLFKDGDLLQLGRLADTLNKEKNQNVIGYVIDRNINYSNVCMLRCKFCAFRRDKGEEGSWEHPLHEIDEKIEDLLTYGGTQILMQGGHHPQWKIEDYTRMLSHIRGKYPQIHIHAFSPPEIDHISRLNKISYEETLRLFKEAGLHSLPGGGAEILVDRIRKKISAGKVSSENWLKVAQTGHELGIRGSATMMFGHVETVEDRVEHLAKVRELQDKTQGFFAFIPWTYVPGNSPMGGEQVGGHDYLKTLAISRIFMDNFQNIQISWLTQGIKMAQIAMQFGGNDMGSTLLEENVVRSTGVPNHTNVPEIHRVIQEWGYTPRQRDTFYNTLQMH
ncbi:MAG: dehypoxanthine futalosine cyclase [Deltaproteobacteria bacterium]|nr:dehypoxanthine futalosine cyclase [Deltaproteobacteria bacterium]